MAYRDDADAVHHRALVLQHELDEARRRLGESAAELERLRRVKAGRPPVDPPPVPVEAAPAAEPRRAAVLEAAREWLGVLDDRTLVMIGSIIEELATEASGREGLVEQLRPIVDAITASYPRKR